MTLDLAAFVLTRNAGTHVCRAVASIKDHARELVVVDTGSTDDSKEIIRKFWASLPGERRPLKMYDFTVDTHPRAWLTDEPRHFEGGAARLPPAWTWTSSKFLLDYGAARRSAWQRCGTRWAAWLDSDDVWDEAKFLPEIIGAAEQNSVSLVGMPYHYRRDERGHLTHLHTVPRLAIVKGSTWKAKVHETLVSTGTSGKFFDFGAVSDMNDRPRSGPQVTAPYWKGLYYQYLTGGLRHARGLYHLGMESRAVDPVFAIKIFSECMTVDDWAERRAKCAYESGLIVEELGTLPTALVWYEQADQLLPGYPDALYGRARVSVLLDRPRECLNFTSLGDYSRTETVLSHNPEVRTVWSRYHRARAFLALGQRDQALEDAHALVALRPENPRFVELLTTAQNSQQKE